MSAKDGSRVPQLTADAVPGKLCAGDKEKIAQVYNIVRNSDASNTMSLHCSRLRVIDSLATRFKFVVSNPRNVTLSLLRAARLKLGCARDITMDLQGNKFVVDCWRGDREERRGLKRGRQPAPLDRLPQAIESALSESARDGADGDLTFLRGIMLWILNRRDFCEFDFLAEREQGYEGADVYKLTLGQFEPVSDAFVCEMEDHWGAFIKDVIFEYSSRSVILYVAK